MCKQYFTIIALQVDQNILLQFSECQASQKNNLNSPDNFPIRGLVLQIYVTE